MLAGFVVRSGGDVVERRAGSRWGVINPLTRKLEPLQFVPESPSGPVFKYVPVRYADAFAKGAIRIGTLRSFGEVEERRADNGEGIHTVHSGVLTAGGKGPTAWSIGDLAKFGIKADHRSTVQMRNCRFNQESADKFGLCFQERPDTPDADDDPQAVFEIVDLEELAWRITEACPSLSEFAIGRIAYAPRETMASRGSAPPQPSPFVKPPAFAWEHEVRIIWPLFTPGAIRPFVREFRVKDLLRRIR